MGSFAGCGLGGLGEVVVNQGNREKTNMDQKPQPGDSFQEGREAAN